MRKGSIGMPKIGRLKENPCLALPLKFRVGNQFILRFIEYQNEVVSKASKTGPSIGLNCVCKAGVRALKRFGGKNGVPRQDGQDFSLKG